MRISIITPVYNRADCIMRCMESVTNSCKSILIHGGKNAHTIEQVIVDDGSKDDTPAIVREYRKGHPHVRFIEFTKNRGTNAARNAAIATAQGLYLIPMIIL